MVERQIEQLIQANATPSLANFGEFLKKALTLYPDIKSRYLGADGEERKIATREGIMLFEAIDQELRRTAGALSMPPQQILAQIPTYLNREEQFLLREAHALWDSYRKEKLRQLEASPVRRRPKVSSLRIKI